MKESLKSRILGINTVLLSALFGLVYLNKKFIRPRFEYEPVAGVLTGCFPNFLAAFIISLFIVTPVLIRKLESGRLFVYAGSCFVFIILTVEEFKPMWGASETYDPWDVMASGVGSLFAIGVFELLERTRTEKN